MEKKNKEFIKLYVEDFWNKHDISAYEKFYTSDLIVHLADGDQDYEQYKGICQAYFTAFPDLYLTINDLIAEGNKVTKVWTSKSTHKGELMGIPATGKQIETKGIDVLRITDGKIAEVWFCMDTLGMMQQLGVIPKMG